MCVHRHNLYTTALETASDIHHTTIYTISFIHCPQAFAASVRTPFAQLTPHRRALETPARKLPLHAPRRLAPPPGQTFLKWLRELRIESGLAHDR